MAAAQKVFFGPSEMARLCRDFDWSQTPLGPVEGWHSALRHAIGNLLAQPFACNIIWGPKQTLIYNDAFIPVAGEKHPWALGQPVGDVFPEATPARSPIVERVLGGESIYTEDALFKVVRGGAVTDAWFTLSCVPLRDDAGDVAGTLTTAIETTARLVAEREKQRRDVNAAFLAGASDGLVSAASEGAALAFLAPRVGEFFRAARCHFLDLDDDAQLAWARQVWQRPGVAGPESSRAMPLDVAVTAPLLNRLREGRALICRDAAASPGVCRELGRVLGLGAFIVAPLVRDGHCRLALCVSESGPRAWERDEAELLQELTERLGLRVERARAERRIIETAESYRTLFETMGEAFCVLEIVRDDAGNAIDARFHELNRRAEAVIGKSREQLIGRMRSEYGPPQLLPVYAGVADSGEAARFEFPSQDGRWYDIRAYSRGADRVAVLYDDITRRKRTEAALRESTERLRLALGAAKMGTFVWFPSEDRVEPDLHMLALFGLPEGGNLSLQAALASLLHPDDRVRIADAAARVLDPAGDGYLNVEARVLLPEGGERWLALTGQVFFEGGVAQRLAGVALDISPQKRAEQTLRASEERQAFLLELSDALRPLVDPIAIQYEACRLLGEKVQCDRTYYAEVDDAGQNVSITREYRREGAPSSVGTYPMAAFDWAYRAFRQGKTLVIEDSRVSELIPPAQRSAMAAIRVCAFMSAPLYKDGRLLGCFTATDLTSRVWTAQESDLVQEVAERTWAAVERARAEAALASELAAAATARAQAEAANQAKDAFLATLSHELRTPLAAILLWAGALRSGAVPIADLARAIDAIVKSAESQSRLIEDLLDMSRLASGKLALGCDVVDVRNVAQVALDMVKPQASAKQLTLTADLGGECLAVLDGARLEQVLWNLLTNATKFTPTGGAVTLRVRADETRGIEIEVRDTGEGIAPEFLPHLFEKFRQYDMGETRQHMGLGIGLALARQLVELHAGSIEAESEGLGRGALFRVRLPWHKPDGEARAAVGPALVASTDDTPLQRLRVLLVDDDALTRQAMRWTLTRAGASVVDVGTADEALAALGSGDGADVIVSDLGLPFVSGLTMIRRIVQNARRQGRRTPPSCAVSAHARDVDRRRAIDAGFDMYITKPVSAERLVEAVSDLKAILASGRD